MKFLVIFIRMVVKEIGWQKDLKNLLELLLKVMSHTPVEKICLQDTQKGLGKGQNVRNMTNARHPLVSINTHMKLGKMNNPILIL